MQGTLSSWQAAAADLEPALRTPYLVSQYATWHSSWASHIYASRICAGCAYASFAYASCTCLSFPFASCMHGRSGCATFLIALHCMTAPQVYVTGETAKFSFRDAEQDPLESVCIPFLFVIHCVHTSSTTELFTSSETVSWCICVHLTLSGQ